MDFGRIEPHEHAIYRFTTSTPVVPRVLFAHAPGSSPRSFIVVPDSSLIEILPQLRKLPRSTALGAHFQYLGESPLEVQLQSDPSAGSVAHMAFAVARWGRKSTSPFPRTMHVLAEDATLGHSRDGLTDVVRATHGPIIGGKVAS